MTRLMPDKRAAVTSGSEPKVDSLPMWSVSGRAELRWFMESFGRQTYYVMVGAFALRRGLRIGLSVTLFLLLSACSSLIQHVPGVDGTEVEQDGQGGPYGTLLFSASGLQDDGDRRYGFASSLDVSGERFIVGSLGGQDVSRGDGAFIYAQEGDTWRRDAHLDIVPAVRPESTASSVALDGDYAAVNYLCGVGSGKPCWQEPSGYFIFEYDGVDWIEAAHFRGDTVHGNEGSPLEFAGDYLFAGRDDGSVDVHHAGSGEWERVQRLVLDGVGFSNVVADGEHLLGLSPQGLHHYRLVAGQWVHRATSLDAQMSAGWLDLEDGRLAVSLAEEDRTKTYLFEREEWQHESEIEHSGPVALSGRYMLVGAPSNDDLAEDAGAVHVYELISGNWERVNTIYAPDPGEDRKFGNRLAANEGLAVVGAFSSDYDRSDFSGAVYVFGHESAQ